MPAELFSAAHSIALDYAAVADAVLIGEAAAVDTENTVASGNYTLEHLTNRTEILCRTASQILSVLEYSQNALIARALDTHEHELVLAIDRKHLITLLCGYRRAIVIYAGLIDV